MFRTEYAGLKRTMVKTMTAAWRVPHFGYCDEVHMDATMLLRSKVRWSDGIGRGAGGDYEAPEWFMVVRLHS